MPDYTYEISGLEINHHLPFLSLVFECNLNGQSSCALYDLLIIMALCPINCQKCSDESSC